MKKTKPQLTTKELIAFRSKNEMDQKALAALLGVTWQAVRLWELGERGVPETTVRLIKMFQKFPQLMKEF
jgi:DNA-binding transcriptional regulator YiaG